MAAPPPIALRPRDLVLALKLAVSAPYIPSQRELSSALHQSLGETHGSLRRLVACHFLHADRTLLRDGLVAFLEHGVHHVFPSEAGRIVSGRVTGPDAPALADLDLDYPVVWVWPGSVPAPARGHAVTPLYPAASEAADDDPELYALLALVDILRVSAGAPWRVRALHELRRRLAPEPAA